MKILVIEDQQTTAHYLKKGLIEQGFSVDSANNGLEGLFLTQENTYDLIILDVMLPKLDGWAVLKKIREQKNYAPILLLTAKDDVEDRVKGLELGADDYLVKPFAFSELCARIHALLRRANLEKPNLSSTITIDNLVIDFQSMKVTRDNQPIDLTAKEFLLLSYFARNQGKPLSRTMIAEHVWDINFDSETNIVDVAIRRLRTKIDYPFSKPLIHTKRGIGYVFESK